MKREELAKTMRQIAPTLGDNKTQIEQLRCFWFDAAKKRAWTYNEVVATESPYEGDLSGGVGGAFQGIIENSSATDIDLKVTDRELSFVTVGTKGNVSIRGMDESIHPFPDGNEPDATVELTGNAEAALRHVNINASQSGVTVVPEGDELSFYATDNKTISWARIALPEGYNVPRLLLSPQLCQRLQVIMEGGSTILDVFSNSVVATSVASGVRLFGRLTSEEHPRPFRQAIEAAFSDDFVMPIPEGIADAVKRVRVLAQAGQPAKMRVTLAGPDIHFSFSSTYGSLDEHFAVKGNTRNVDALFDPEFLNVGLGAGAPIEIAIADRAFAVLTEKKFGYIVKVSKPD